MNIFNQNNAALKKIKWHARRTFFIAACFLSSYPIQERERETARQTDEEKKFPLGSNKSQEMNKENFLFSVQREREREDWTRENE